MYDVNHQTDGCRCKYLKKDILKNNNNNKIQLQRLKNTFNKTRFYIKNRGVAHLGP